MGELLNKYSKGEEQKPSATTGSTRGPPVPAKDKAPSRPPTRGAMAPPSARSAKRRRLVTCRPALQNRACADTCDSHEISGGDKENELQTPQKKMRAQQAADVSRNPAHVLSPTTSNSRMVPRTAATPGRSGIARPAVTPGRAVLATNILNKMVDGGRSTTRPTTATAARKTMTSSTTSATTITTTTTTTASSTSTAAARRKRGATTTAAFHQPQPAPAPTQPISRPATRTARRASGTSESSEGSTATVIRKRPMTAPPGAQPKPPPSSSASSSSQAAAKRTTVMGTIKKGVSTATGRKTPVAGAAAGGGKAGTGRVLRKRA